MVAGMYNPGHLVFWRPAMPLQNRVNPFGELTAVSTRGLFMGNRGGRIHDDNRHLARRRWTSRQWICCKLEFKNRHRNVWGDGYTELFFLDEVTALAAGHRPCFECRRQEAEHFATLFAGNAKRVSAPVMDKILHGERLDGKAKRTRRGNFDALPDGAVIAMDGPAFAIRDGQLLRWSPVGYDETRGPPSATEVDVLTPPSILAVLGRGYAPRWHPSAD